MTDWKEVLYRAYVSSGQVADVGGSAEEQFRPRRAYFESVVRAHFPAERNSRILDIGCGHGALLYFLHEAGYGCLRGVDGSGEQVELAHRLGVPGVEQGDAFSFIRECETGSAEVVCLFDVLEHLTRQESFDLLIEVRRVLSPGGVCIGHVPNAEGIFGSRIRYGDLTHEQAFTARSIGQIFGALGFQDIRCFEDKPLPHGLKSLARRALWNIGTLPARVLFAAESGSFGVILSQNLLFRARRGLDLPGASA